VWATEKILLKRIAALTETAKVLERKNRVQQIEIDSLAAVIARDRQRVKAETAIASRTIAAVEGTAK
jgi:hypothetical protein